MDNSSLTWSEKVELRPKNVENISDNDDEPVKADPIREDAKEANPNGEEPKDVTPPLQSDTEVEIAAESRPVPLNDPPWSLSHPRKNLLLNSLNTNAQ